MPQRSKTLLRRPHTIQQTILANAVMPNPA